MTVSQRSVKTTFMQPRGGVKKSETVQDIIHLHPNRMFRVDCSDSIIMPLQSARTVFHCLCRIFLVFLQR